MAKVEAQRRSAEQASVRVDNIHRDEVHGRMRYAAVTETDDLFDNLETSLEGLTQKQVEASRKEYGDNNVTRRQKESLTKRLSRAFVNPFTVILFVLAIVSVFTDIVFADPEEGPDFMAVIIITTMVIISGVLRFVQESRSGRAAENLLKMVKTTTNVQRKETGTQEIPMGEVVVGDIVHLAAGDMIPADMRIFRARDLFISQSALTGESDPLEKIPTVVVKKFNMLLELDNMAFMGSNVVSGTASGVIISTGNDTIYGEAALASTGKAVQTSFEKGVNSVSWVLIRFMLCMVPIVFLINGFTKGDWVEALLFGLAVAVGLTPEMLPMIVTACLAKGAVAMAKEKTIIKNLNSIQNVGAINVLCTDKTGTLTQDRVILQYHYNVHAEEDDRILRHAFLNSYYQTGLRNLMDKAIIEKTEELESSIETLRGLADKFTKVDEIPFDFERRRMSVVVKNGKTQMITKGAADEMLSVCSHAEYEGKEVPLTEEVREYIRGKIDDLNEDGLRVLVVAQKNDPSPAGAFSVADEKDMTLIGYLAFLDPPKESTAGAIKSLQEHNVAVKVLTGDNEKVARTICRQVGLEVDRILTGAEVRKMKDTALEEAVEEVTVFARLSPTQKSRVITALRTNGHTVGFMGDGINDAAGMKAADVGISVDTAVDIAKESADVILLEKDLMVLEKGIIEGRKTYGNMIKYIKMTASSNFGNMFSVLAASAFLPFLPMFPIHIIFLNLIYDISCTAIPWDNVDREFFSKPRKWDASSIGKFMLWIGPTSSVFDITTYLLMYFIICPALVSGGLLFNAIPIGTIIESGVFAGADMRFVYMAMFQAGWFVESMWSQTLVIHMIRTPKIPFIQSRASAPLTLLTFTGIAVLTIIPFTPFGHRIGLVSLPAAYFPWLIAMILLYMLLATALKLVFIKLYKELL